LTPITWGNGNQVGNQKSSHGPTDALAVEADLDSPLPLDIKSGILLHVILRAASTELPKLIILDSQTM
jgi:hypothetical protein